LSRDVGVVGFLDFGFLDLAFWIWLFGFGFLDLAFWIFFFLSFNSII
jgi:hypothetical protein